MRRLRSRMISRRQSGTTISASPPVATTGTPTTCFLKVAKVVKECIARFKVIEKDIDQNKHEEMINKFIEEVGEAK